MQMGACKEVIVRDTTALVLTCEEWGGSSALNEWMLNDGDHRMQIGT